MAVGQAEEFGKGVVRVDAHAHRVGVGGRIGPVKGVASTGPAGGRVAEPCIGTRRIHELSHRDIDGASGLLGVLQVLVEVVPADPPRGVGELTVGQMADEILDSFACRPIPRSWHIPRIATRCDNSKKLAPDGAGRLAAGWGPGRVVSGRAGSYRFGPDLATLP